MENSCEIINEPKKIEMNSILEKTHNNINELIESKDNKMIQKRNENNINIIPKIKIKYSKNDLQKKTVYQTNRILLINIYNFLIKFDKLDMITKILIISFINLFFSLSVCKQRNILFNAFEITLKINGTGNIQLFSDVFFNRYSNCEININDAYNITTNTFYFNNSEIMNTVKIKWNNPNINNTSSMFKDCNNINEIDFSNFDTSQVKDMSKMFYNCSSLNKINLSNFITSTAESMYCMFCGCVKLISLDLSNFKTENVYNMDRMFMSCISLSSLNLSNFKTQKVNNMASMFDSCKNLVSLDLSNFNTLDVQDMSQMFKKCINLNILELSNFNTKKVKDMNQMFYGCISLKFLNLSSFDTSNVKDMSEMFFSCSSLEQLNLFNFNTSYINDTEYMFYNCSKLTSLDLSNFNTSEIKYMYKMFENCNSLKYLDLSNFDTSKVTNMSRLFFNCSSLTSLNLSSFDTSQVKDMSHLFYNCSSLTSLELKNFNTSNVNKMNCMFCLCYSLNSLDLSNFDTSNVDNMKYMFYDCRNLTKLDLSNFNTSHLTSLAYVFNSCISLTSLNLSSFDTSQVTDFSQIFCNCSSLYSLDLSNFDTSKIYSMDKMFYMCKNLTYLNLNITGFNFTNQDIFRSVPDNLIICGENRNNMTALIDITISCQDNNNNSHINEYECYMKSNGDLNNPLACNICGNDNSNCNVEKKNKYIIETTYEPYISETIEDLIYNTTIVSSFIHQTIHAFNEGIKISTIINDITYINETDINIYSTNVICYNSCKTCEISGDDTLHNCLECKDGFIYEHNISNSSYKNCYNNTFDIINNTIVTDFVNQISSLLTNDKIESTNLLNTYDIISDTISINGYNQFSSSLKIDNVEPTELLENKTENTQSKINNLINDFNMTEISSGKDKKIIDGNKVIILTSTTNQENNEASNNVTMNLGKCEDNLKRDYNISDDAPLYILQVITEEEGMKIPKVEYEIYYPLNNSTNLTKLNLTSCKDTKIEISIAVKIDGSLDKYNPKSDYYNDICSKATSDTGTDITLGDRKNEYVNNNMSLCEENCELIEYDQKTEKAKCSCDIKVNTSPDYETKFIKNDFFKNFIDINNLININIMKCYKNVLKVKYLLKNYGFMMVGFINVFYLMSLFIFICCSFNKMKKEILKIYYTLKVKGNPIKKKAAIKEKGNKKKKKKFFDKKKLSDKKNDLIDKSILLKKNKGKEGNYIGQITQNVTNNLYIKFGGGKENINEKNNLILKKQDFELNALEYIDAFKLDKRNYCQYYGSLIKYNHPFLFSFGSYNDYNSKIIKMFLFFFSFCLDFAINALFFTDDTMHKIYEDKGKFNFFYQIPQILYSTIISKFIDSFVRNFALTQENIVALKQEKDKKFLGQKHKKLLRVLKCKFVSFFISTLIVLVFLWYYITCFCGIYINTQFHLIKDSMISLITSLLIPFVLYIIPGIFRISALRAEKPTRKFLYNFSCFLENWLG